MRNQMNIVVLMLAFLLSEPVRGTMFLEKSGREDLETSASEYSYQVRSDSPSEYEKDFEEYKSGPSVGRYSYDPVPLEKLSLSPNHQSLESKFGPADSYRYPYAKGYEKFLDHQPKGFLDDYNFAKSTGLDYLNSYATNDGEKSSKGYSDNDRFAKGLKGRHEKDSKNGFYDAVGGHQKGRSQEADEFSKNHQMARADKGGSFANEKSHDKGSKTTGYEKVYRKEEFKKDRSFYDNKKNKGHFNRYGNFDSAAASEAGASTKGRNLDAAYEAGKHGAKGLSDKGSFVDEIEGYKGAEGDAKYYRNGATYKGGKSVENVNGYSKRND